jgi:rhodanese-related sulfurtransferase
MTTVTAEQLRSMQQRNGELLLVNTLSPESFVKTKIPGAVNIPQNRKDFVNRARDEAGGLEKTIVVYCASAECDSSHQAAQKLEQAGFQKVFDLAGGYEAWKEHQAAAPAHASAVPR